jgi:hypothetical protein
MDQGRGLQGLARLFLGQLLSRELAQLLIDEGQKLLRRARIALLDGKQDARDLIHGRHHDAKNPRDN